MIVNHLRPLLKRKDIFMTSQHFNHEVIIEELYASSSIALEKLEFLVDRYPRVKPSLSNEEYVRNSFNAHADILTDVLNTFSTDLETIKKRIDQLKTKP